MVKKEEVKEVKKEKKEEVKSTESYVSSEHVVHIKDIGQK